MPSSILDSALTNGQKFGCLLFLYYDMVGTHQYCHKLTFLNNRYLLWRAVAAYAMPDILNCSSAYFYGRLTISVNVCGIPYSNICTDIISQHSDIKALKILLGTEANWLTPS